MRSSLILTCSGVRLDGNFLGGTRMPQQTILAMRAASALAVDCQHMSGFVCSVRLPWQRDWRLGQFGTLTCTRWCSIPCTVL